ncbi:MAG: hypothetical protein ACI31R_00710 [Bacilli bacterium]
MDYNTLKNIIYNMPETYEEATKTNSEIVSIIQNEILLDNLIKYGIFKSKEDYFNQCSERYNEIRNDVIKQLEEIEKEDE